jgi:hypothetical protein
MDADIKDHEENRFNLITVSYNQVKYAVRNINLLFLCRFCMTA